MQHMPRIGARREEGHQNNGENIHVQDMKMFLFCHLK